VTALELERSDGAVIADKVGNTACTFLAGLCRAEQAIADRLIRIRGLSALRLKPPLFGSTSKRR
jgi:hypothetical protein